MGLSAGDVVSGAWLELTPVAMATDPNLLPMGCALRHTHLKESVVVTNTLSKPILSGTRIKYSYTFHGQPTVSGTYVLQHDLPPASEEIVKTVDAAGMLMGTCTGTFERGMADLVVTSVEWYSNTAARVTVMNANYYSYPSLACKTRVQSLKCGGQLVKSWDVSTPVIKGGGSAVIGAPIMKGSSLYLKAHVNSDGMAKELNLDNNEGVSKEFPACP